MGIRDLIDGLSYKFIMIIYKPVLPELDRLNSNKMILICFRAARNKHNISFCEIMTVMVVFIISFLVIRHVSDVFIQTMALIFAVFFGLMFPRALPLFLWRSVFRRNFRIEMVRLGVPICVNCGYNTNGLSGTSCPECGHIWDVG